MSPPTAADERERHLHHYRVEKQLAEQLRNASREERLALYSEIYERLFREVPDHPQLARKADTKERERRAKASLRLLERFLTPSSTFLEIGAGDCSLSFAVAERVASVIALDVSETIAGNQAVPANYRFVLSDGVNIPVSAESVDIAFSDQLMEHLHPDDAREQLSNIYRALVPGGRYICITPNRIYGPTDISGYFSNVTEGLHLKEYTYAELAQLFLKTGFSDVQACVRAGGIFAGRPILMRITPQVSAERILELLPDGARRRVAGSRVLRPLLRITLVGTR